VQHHPPIVDPARLPVQRARTWDSLATSVVLHVALLALVLGVLSRDRTTAETPKAPTDPGRQVDMVFLPTPTPAPRPAPTPALPRSRPEPPVERPATPVPVPPRPLFTAPPPRPADPEANALPDAPRTDGVREPEEMAAATPKRPHEAPGEAAAAASSRLSEMESEAQRLFGRPKGGAGGVTGPVRSRPFENGTESNERCAPVPRPAPGAPPQMGTAVGKILRLDNGLPLAGAHLQMVGTPYVAFTDAQGEYRFVFDLALVADCRQQFVRVTAPGFESRMLTLVIGERTRGDDVGLRRR
jgi:hypothetical protein